MKTYQGSCHCGRTRFEVDADIDHVRACDCSVCIRRGALNHRVVRDRLRLLVPWTHLTLYHWGSKTAKDWYCPVGGIWPGRRPSDTTPQELGEGVEQFRGWAVNVRCLEDLDMETVPVRKSHGSRIEHDS